MGIIVRTLSEQVFDVVREQIVSGQIASDVPIRQDALAAELGVSKIPLREALARLEQEGLLTSQPNRGYFVRAMSIEEAEEIFALRLALEPDAAALAAASATKDEREQVRDAFARLDRAADENLNEVALRNRELHTVLVRPAGRPLTMQLIERLALMAERYVIAHLGPAGRDARAHREHRGLVKAWLSGDEKSVKQRLAAHIQGTLDDLKQQLSASAD